MSAPSPDQPTIRFVDVDGIRLRTSVRGCGPPLLLVTGLGASLDMARPFEQELTARGVQTVAFDAPGIGESTAYTLPRRMPGIARTIEAMLDALGYDRVDVLGVSLGGVVAQQLAHQAPRRVRRLVLAATGPGLGGAPGSPRVLLALATPRRYHQPDTIGASPGGSTAGRPAATPTHCCTDRPPGSWNGPRSAGTSARCTPSPAGPACLGCTGSGNRRSCWPATTTRSSRCSTDASSSGRIPDARLHVVDGGGHLFLLERPAEMAALVTGFLAERR
ncbi:MAG TPA: alpha/beta hydrolase [Mycobacteriales bacterium]